MLGIVSVVDVRVCDNAKGRCHWCRWIKSRVRSVDASAASLEDWDEHPFGYPAQSTSGAHKPTIKKICKMSAVPTSGALPRTYSILAGRYAATLVPLPTPHLRGGMRCCCCMQYVLWKKKDSPGVGLQTHAWKIACIFALLCRRRKERCEILLACCGKLPRT